MKYRPPATVAVFFFKELWKGVARKVPLPTRNPYELGLKSDKEALAAALASTLYYAALHRIIKYSRELHWLETPLPKGLGFSKEIYTEYLPEFHRKEYGLGVEELEALKRIGELAYKAGKRLMENEELLRASLELSKMLEEKEIDSFEAIPYITRNHKDYLMRLYREIPEIREILKIVAKFHPEPREILEEIEKAVKPERPETTMEELVRKAVMDVMLSVGEKERPIVPKVESWEGLRSLLEAYEEALEEAGYHSTRLLVSGLRNILENEGTLSNEDLGRLAEGAGAIREIYEFVQRNPWFLEGILGGGDVEKYSAHLKRRVAFLEVPDEFRGVAENLARSFVERAAKEGAGAQDKREVLNRLLRSVNAQASYWAKVESVLRRYAGEERIEPHSIAESLAELVPGAWNRAIERKIVIR